MIKIYHQIIQKFRMMDLFRRCVSISFSLHLLFIGTYYLSSMPAFSSDAGEVFDSRNISFKNTEVDFVDLPPSVILGGDTNPAPVQKEEWVEGTGRGRPDAGNTDVNINKLSGTGTDPDGYMFADLADHPPVPIIDFNPDDFFPQAARSANIHRSTVLVEVQVNENGSVKNFRLLSAASVYGFDEAAVKVLSRMRFRPGKVNGRPVKMLARMPLVFALED
ncbi:MAG: energy transducer TonB [Spirochaetota bacterium]